MDFNVNMAKVNPAACAPIIERVRAACDAGDGTLGVTVEEAGAMMETLAADTAFSDDAMRAYDLLHNVVTYGRAW